MSFLAFIKQHFSEGSAAQPRLVCLDKYAWCQYGSWLYKDTSKQLKTPLTHTYKSHSQVLMTLFKEQTTHRC